MLVMTNYHFGCQFRDHFGVGIILGAALRLIFLNLVYWYVFSLPSPPRFEMMPAMLEDFHWLKSSWLENLHKSQTT